MVQDIAKYIDHTLLSPTATIDNITTVCEDAVKYGFRSVCVNSVYVGLAAHLLAGTGVKVVSTCAYPLGAVKTQVKVFEAQKAFEDKADEIDMVINLAAAKSGNWQAVAEDIKAVVQAVPVPVKAIIETRLLTDEEKQLACAAVIQSGAYCVKTCSSNVGGGVKIKDILILHSITQNKIKIKASGGIRTRRQAVALLNAGADYLGTSASPVFVQPGAE